MLKFFDENSIEKLHFLFIFGKFVTKNRGLRNNTSYPQQFQNHALNFRAFGRKTKLFICSRVFVFHYITNMSFSKKFSPYSLVTVHKVSRKIRYRLLNALLERKYVRAICNYIRHPNFGMLKRCLK